MTVPPTIESLHIRGFRSLADVEIESLPRVALLIGANGSGKSNLICFFELLSWMLKSRRLAEFVGRQGGADDQLFRGSKVTPRIEAEISMRSEGGRHEYRFALDYADPDRFIFSSEAFRRLADSDAGADEGWTELGSGHSEARLVEVAQGREFDEPERTAAQTILHVLRGCATYHFHDTSGSSRMKQSWDVEDAVQLRPDGGNLGPVLLRLERHEIRRYEWICRQIGRILPGFDRFDVTQQFGKALLGWKAKGSDKRIGAHLTSDGSLRFFALVTLLNLPPEMLPDLLLLDEPELGLHPAAVELIGHMISSVGVERQIMLATQSEGLVDVFGLDALLVLELKDGRTTCCKIDASQHEGWFEDGYTPSGLWNTNLLGGRP